MEAPQGGSLGRYGGILAGGIVAVTAGSVMATREHNPFTVGVVCQSGEGAVAMKTSKISKLRFLLDSRGGKLQKIPIKALLACILFQPYWAMDILFSRLVYLQIPSKNTKYLKK